MAIGTSAADLMISMISLFVTQNTVGLGTIIGSELFNHLIISASCVMNSKNRIELNPYIFTREIFSYALTLALLMALLTDASYNPKDYDNCLSVHWYIGFILLFFYVLYALLVIYFEFFFKVRVSSNSFDTNSTVNPLKVKLSSGQNDLENKQILNFPSVNNGIQNLIENPIQNKLLSDGVIERGFTDYEKEREKEVRDATESRENRGSSVGRRGSSLSELRSEIKAEETSSQLASGVDVFRDSSAMSSKRKATVFIKAAIYYATLPLRYVILYTIPDPNIKEYRKYYPLSAFLSVVWLGGLAQALLQCLDILGNVMGITPIVVGLTIGAWGASMPTLWSSMVVYFNQILSDYALLFLCII